MIPNSNGPFVMGSTVNDPIVIPTATTTATATVATTAGSTAKGKKVSKGKRKR